MFAPTVDVPHPSGLGGQRQIFDLPNGIAALAIIGFPGSDGIEVHAGIHDPATVDNTDFEPDYRIQPEINGLDEAGLQSSLEALAALPPR